MTTPNGAPSQAYGDSMPTQTLASYNDAISVSFRNDAWFNATQVAAHFGKRPVDWLRLDETKEYTKAIVQICTIEENQLISIKRGAPDTGGGSWMHPKLGIPFARWLDPKFGVWCDLQIEKILHGAPDPLLLQKSSILDRIAVFSERTDSVTISEAAKIVEMPQRQFFQHLAKHKLIYRRSPRSRWLATKPALDEGLLTYKYTVYLDEDEVEQLSPQARLTPSGVAKAVELLSIH